MQAKKAVSTAALLSTGLPWVRIGQLEQVHHSAARLVYMWELLHWLPLFSRGGYHASLAWHQSIFESFVALSCLTVVVAFSAAPGIFSWLAIRLRTGFHWSCLLPRVPSYPFYHLLVCPLPHGSGVPLSRDREGCYINSVWLTDLAFHHWSGFIMQNVIRSVTSINELNQFLFFKQFFSYFLGKITRKMSLKFFKQRFATRFIWQYLYQPKLILCCCEI